MPPKPATPTELPHDCPVRCLGREGKTYYFLDACKHFIDTPVREISRNLITALFGGEEYLIEWWPDYIEVDGQWVPSKHKWQHGALMPILVKTCQRMGAWNPKEKIRDVGGWREEDWTLVFHQGDLLYTSKIGEPKAGIGLRGKLLYPAAPALPEPIRNVMVEGGEDANGQWGPNDWAKVQGPGARIMQTLVTWNFERPFNDPILILGDIVCAMLGGALEWRPMMCITGDSRTGKSSLLDGIKAIIGQGAYISSGNATRAAIATLIGNSTKPVILDEFERGDDDKVHAAITQFMTLSSSGETLDRGTPGAETHTFQARNCFILSAINLPTLRAQELNRIFTIDLKKLDHPVGPRDPDAPGDTHKVWGSLSELTKIGRQLRGRLLDQWHRWRDTLRVYQEELSLQGHDRRSADQFGSALAGYDLVMFDEIDEVRVRALVSWFKPKEVSETAEVKGQGERCLDHMLEQTLGLTRGGPQQTLGKWIQQSRHGFGTKEGSDADEVLAQIGWAVGLKNGFVEGLDPADDEWMVAIATSHSGTAKLVEGTGWHTKAGGTSGYVDVLKRLEGAMLHRPNGERVRIRIENRKTYVVLIPYRLLFG